MLQLSKAAANGLNIAKIKALSTELNKLDSKQWSTSVTMAVEIAKAHKWLTNPEGSTWLKSTKLGMEEMISAVYGWKKNQYYIYIQAGRAMDHNPKLLGEFEAQVETLRNKGENVALSIENFNNFAKAVESKKAEAVESKNGGGENEGENSAKVETKKKAILTLSFNGESLNVANIALRIDAAGKLKTEASEAEILHLFEYIKTAMGVKPTPAAKPAKKGKAQPKPNTAKAAKATKAEILKGIGENMAFEAVTMDDVA